MFIIWLVVAIICGLISKNITSTNNSKDSPTSIGGEMNCK